MIKDRSEIENRKIEIDLSGPKGNAFVLLGLAEDLGKQLGMSKGERAKVSEEMKSSDYNNLITVLDRHFGEYIVLYKAEAASDSLDDDAEEQSRPSPKKRRAHR